MFVNAVLRLVTHPRNRYRYITPAIPPHMNRGILSFTKHRHVLPWNLEETTGRSTWGIPRAEGGAGRATEEVGFVSRKTYSAAKWTRSFGVRVVARTWDRWGARQEKPCSADDEQVVDSNRGVYKSYPWSGDPLLTKRKRGFRGALSWSPSPLNLSSLIRKGLTDLSA